MPRPASTRCWTRSGSRGPTAVPIAVPASTVPTLMSVPTIAAVQDGRPRDNARSMAGTDVLSSRSAAPPDCARPTTRSRRAAARRRVGRARARARRASRARSRSPTSPGRCRRGARPRARRCATRGRARSSTRRTHRGAAVARAGRDPLRRAGGRQPAGPPRDLAAPARAPPLRRRAAAACRWSEGALAEAPAPHGPALVRADARSSDRDAPARARHRGDHLRRQPRARRASTACWPRGARPGARARRSSSPGSRAATRTASATPAWSRRPSTARCCAARASSSPRRAARTTGSRSSRRWPTAACSSRPPSPGPYAALPLARALDPRLVGDDLAARAADRARRPVAGLRRARARGARAVGAGGGRRGRARAAAAGAAGGRAST